LICRHCRRELRHVFLDLGFAPPSNAYLEEKRLAAPEVYFPLRLFVCETCWLVQTDDHAGREQLFSDDYAYFSSVSTSWLNHARSYSEMIIERLGLGTQSLVVEVASNDGYLLKNFVASGIPCVGIEPTESTARAAEAQGIPVLREFFGETFAKRLASERGKADLIVGNNVYAHVPDINDFTRGMKSLLAPGGTITLEFPHLMRLIEHTQFDTVYHEHFSYLSLATASRIFNEAGLRIWHVEELPTHGGSLRLYGCHKEDSRAETDAVARLLQQEKEFGLQDLGTYLAFQERADRVKDEFLSFLIGEKAKGRTVAAYGAAAKGNTLLNYAGVKRDLLAFVADAAASKQGKFLPGSHIPIVAPEAINEHRPDILFILPWNIAPEITAQQAIIREWSGQFAVAVPRLRTF
jgi:SAM-dependent methyltransferase